ncbi:MAG: MFS transporter [Proteobacteria bacterium]|nr:MFS transporter [Pseudomonadota bacterium]
MTTNTQKISFLALLLMISFASVNAVLFTPALPDIERFFRISDSAAEKTITWFLIGYALGQLLYGPLANRFGRKKALFAGIGLQIISSFMCVASGLVHTYWLLVVARLFLALGSGVGLKMTFTLVNECYPTKIATQKISYLMLAFAITPGLAIALGGLLNSYLGWMSCFYAGAVYGILLFFLVIRLPETATQLDYHALEIHHLIAGYQIQFKNISLVAGGLLMGMASSFIYVFAALSPFIAINLLQMTSAQYGIYSILPSAGLLIGSLCSAQFAKKYPPKTGILYGTLLTIAATIWMLIAVWIKQPPLISLFLPMILSYFGLALVFPNASTLAMSQITDKAHGSAVMNFINMGLVTVIVLSLEWFKTTTLLLPVIYLLIGLAMLVIYCLKIQSLPK